MGNLVSGHDWVLHKPKQTPRLTDHTHEDMAISYQGDLEYRIVRVRRSAHCSERVAQAQGLDDKQ
jgi:hypothetical protein